MLHFETDTERYADSFSGFSVPPEKILFLDIETTGFSADSAYVYLIGAAFFTGGRVRMRQWLLDDFSCEKELLSGFLKFAADFSLLVHYNGAAFDVPFLQRRCRRYRLADRLFGLPQEDLYRRLSPYRRLLGLADLKQKTVEDCLGLRREDRFSGGDLIPVYAEFLGRYRYEKLKAQSAAPAPLPSEAPAAGPAPAVSDGNPSHACGGAVDADTPDFSNTGLVQMPETPAKALLYVLLLHNREDLVGLLSIAPLTRALSALADACGWEPAPQAGSALQDPADSESAAVVFRLQSAAVSGMAGLLFPEPLSKSPLPAVKASGPVASASAPPCSAKASAPPLVNPAKASATPLSNLAEAAALPFSIPAKAPAPPLVSLAAEPDGSLALRIPFLSGTLKYFFDDYENYYYLPLEDRAIHKSVAEFVDKAYRKKATRKTCYQKKEGQFLPQTEALYTPEFRFSPKDRISFFEPGDAFFKEKQRQERWLAGLLGWLLGLS